MVCPIELLNNISQRLAKSTGSIGINMPGWLKGGWFALLFYLMLQFLMNVFHINKIPVFTSVLFLGFLLLSIASGFIFSAPRSFCIAFCPASILLKNYSRLTSLQLMRISPEKCDACPEKYCSNPKYQDRFDRRSCPSSLKPFDRHIGDDCTLCFQCVKICPYDNLGFGIINPGAYSQMFKPLLSACALYVFLEAGFVLYELIEEVGWFEGVNFAWFLLAGPFVFISLLWIISRLCKSGLGLPEFIRRVGIFLLPSVAAAHVSKAIMELNESTAFILPKQLIIIAAACLIFVSPVISMRYFKQALTSPGLRLSAYAGLIFIVALYLTVIIKAY